MAEIFGTLRCYSNLSLRIYYFVWVSIHCMTLNFNGFFIWVLGFLGSKSSKTVRYSCSCLFLVALSNDLEIPNCSSVACFMRVAEKFKM